MKKKFPPVDWKNWKETKFISGRVATKSDVKNGIACFCLAKIKDHKAIDIELPKIAYLNYDDERYDNEIVVVIQVEFADDSEVVGYRNSKGDNYGITLMQNIDFLSDSIIESATFL